MIRQENFLVEDNSSIFSKYFKPYEILRCDIIKKLIPNGHKKLALDIGCGPGYFARELLLKDWKPVAVDSDKDNLKNAKNFAYQSYFGDALSLLMKLPSYQYDLVLCLELIEHFSKYGGEKLLFEIVRTLRPGGKLIISTPNRISPEALGDYYWNEKIMNKEKWLAWDSTHVYIYSSFEIILLLKKHGFTFDSIIGYYYNGTCPFLRNWSLPFVKSTVFPINRFGFNIIIDCNKV